jgi:hypothetical protein
VSVYRALGFMLARCLDEEGWATLVVRRGKEYGRGEARP